MRIERQGITLAHIGVEGPLVFASAQACTSADKLRAARFQDQLIQRLVDAVDLFDGHHISAHALFDLRQALVIGVLEGLEGHKHVAVVSAGSPPLWFQVCPSCWILLLIQVAGFGFRKSGDARARACDFTVLTRAPSSIGKVTSEISQRSILVSSRALRRLVLAGGHGLEADGKAIEPAGFRAATEARGRAAHSC